jgi:hypothetical protein
MEDDPCRDENLLTEDPLILQEIRDLAQKAGVWREVLLKTTHRNQGISFETPYAGRSAKITYWFLSPDQTVRTSLKHPKHGPGQMHNVEPLTRGELRLMFMQRIGPGTGLRLHTPGKRRRDNAGKHK